MSAARREWVIWGLVAAVVVIGAAVGWYVAGDGPGAETVRGGYDMFGRAYNGFVVLVLVLGAVLWLVRRFRR